MVQIVFNTEDKNYLSPTSQALIMEKINQILVGYCGYGYKAPKVYPCDLYSNSKYVYNIDRVNLEEESIVKECKTPWEDEDDEDEEQEE